MVHKSQLLTVLLLELLAAPPDSPPRTVHLAEEEHKDREILEIIVFLVSGFLPEDEQNA